MFDDNHMDDFDRLMKSVLDGAEETPPAHIWEGVSKGIDKAAGRKTVVLWLRRFAVTSVAAAAAIVAGVMLDTEDAGDSPILLSSDPSLISVVTQTEDPVQDNIKTDLIVETERIEAGRALIAMADIQKPSESKETEYVQIETESVHMEDTPGSTRPEIEKATETVPAEITEDKEAPASDTLHEEYWEEETGRDRRKVRTSLVISGIAGTNNPQNKSGIGPFKSSGILKAPTKTTLEQVGSDKHFGIPVSAGLGVKINFTDRWALGVGVNYTLLTSSFEGKYTKVDEGIVSPSVFADTRNRQHYIGIPINAYFNIIRHDFVNFYAYAGGAVEKCVLNKYQILADQGTINHTEKAKGVQLSADLGIGVEFLIGKYLGIYIDPSLRYYFKGNQPPSIRTSQPLMLGFEMGLRFNL